MTLKGKEFTSTVQGNTTHGTFKIDPTLSPKTIDITFTDGPGKDNTQKGIYELDGDTPEDLLGGAGEAAADGVRGQARKWAHASGPGESEALEWICSLI